MFTEYVIHGAPAPVVEYVCGVHGTRDHDSSVATVVTQTVTTILIAPAIALPSTYGTLPTSFGAAPFW